MFTSQQMGVIQEVSRILHDPAEVILIKELLGLKLMELVKEDYIQKSLGNTGAGGMSWDRTQKGTPIMIDTGRLLESLEIVDNYDGSFGVHFGIFPPRNKEDTGRLIALQKRQAWPDPIPPEWLQALSDILSDFIKDALNRRMLLVAR